MMKINILSAGYGSGASSPGNCSLGDKVYIEQPIEFHEDNFNDSQSPVIDQASP